jgi:hypothetical protein
LVVRRSISLKVAVYCPHLQRNVEATRNEAIDRLVSCAESERCRDRTPAAPDASEHARPFPHGCAVYPSLAK